MGVPVVAKLGKSVASRVSGAILSSIGMGEWAGASDEDYCAIALGFASAPERLRQVRDELPGKIKASASGDPVRYTRAVEHAYQDMWRKYCLSESTPVL